MERALVLLLYGLEMVLVQVQLRQFLSGFHFVRPCKSRKKKKLLNLYECGMNVPL